MISYSLAFVLDLIIGDPYNPYHPVRFIALLAKFLEKVTRGIFKSKKIAGAITWILVIFISFLITYVIVKISYMASPVIGVVVEGIILYFCISYKGLKDEGLKVVKTLALGDIEKARKELSYIVGRDTNSLDEKGILRAVVETLAENSSDGIIAPLLYGALGGAPFAICYKAINTCDSIFGYKNEKYMDFGYVSAKMDDLFNLIPARVTGILIVMASFVLRLDYKGSFKIYKRDRYNHTSPNSAHPEAAVAGALGIVLGGGSFYFGNFVEKPTIGDNNKNINFKDAYNTGKIIFVISVIGFISGLLIIFIGGKL